MRKVHIRQAVDVCVVHGFIFYNKFLKITDSIRRESLLY